VAASIWQLFNMTLSWAEMWGSHGCTCPHCKMVWIDFNCAYTVKSKQASKWLATESEKDMISYSILSKMN